MRANCWMGRTSVEVRDVPDPTILNERDAIVRITSTAICGSDLHLYDGFIPTMEKGAVLGHEFMGEVVEVGKGVGNLQVGDRVVVPFPIACGACNACAAGYYSVCENRSAVRDASARETRRRVLEAAARLFADQGYAGTSLAAIGREAGVSTESVAANGPKRALLIAAFQAVLGGSDESDLVSARQEMQQLLRTADVETLLNVIGDQVVAGAARSIGLWRAFSAAAGQDPEVAQLYDDLSRRRRADARLAMDVLADRGLLRPDVDPQQVADTVALLNGMDAYQLFVREFGWTEEQLKRWWIDATRRLVFG